MNYIYVILNVNQNYNVLDLKKKKLLLIKKKLIKITILKVFTFNLINLKKFIFNY